MVSRFRLLRQRGERFSVDPTNVSPESTIKHANYQGGYQSCDHVAHR